jgi:hypothetical protein
MLARFQVEEEARRIGGAEMTHHAITRRDPRQETEDMIHKGAIQLLRMAAHPSLIFYHIPNGEARSAITGAKLKALGTLAGAADLGLVLPDGRAAFLEFKTRTGRQSPEQREFQRRVINAGALYAVCRCHEDIVSTLTSWGALRLAV